MTRFRSTSDDRLRWRVIVRTAGRLETSQAGRPLAWHLVDCVDAVGPEMHCSVGRQLLIDGDDPDGHCLVGETCPRCAAGN